MKKLRLLLALVLGLALWLTSAGGQQPNNQQGPSVPGEIIVKFARGVSSARRAAKMSAASARILRHFDELDMDHVQIARGKSVQAALDELRGDPEIEWAQPNFIYQAAPAGPPNDPYWLDGSLWGLQKIAAQTTWQTYGSGNGSVIVADIDTGVMYTHPDLAANMWHNPGEIPGNGIDDDNNGYVDDVFGIDTVNHDSDPMDDNSHGTHTAGTMAAVGNNGIGVTGVNWNAKILACKFLDASGSGSDTGAIECFNYILALKQKGLNIRVSSNSWGAARGTTMSTALKSAMDAAGAAGILNVCAAGNNGANADVTPFDPAAFPSSSIVSVAASDQNDNRASFSNYGSVSVDLAAPGVSILSTSTAAGGYESKSGTSMATPHVAGAAALLASLDPTLSVDNLKVALMQNVDVLPQWAGVVASGGRLNVYKAAAAVAPPLGTAATATFKTLDSTTQGNWSPTYGSQGYVIVNDATSLPAYATVTAPNAAAYTWTGSTADVRALKRATTGRIAATWYAGTQFDINLGLADGVPHTVALYCLDWDNGGRIEQLDVYNALTNALLDTRTVSSFLSGKYAVWTITGNVRIHVTNITGVNAVVAGVFIGTSSSDQPPTVSLTSPSGGAQFTTGTPIGLAATATDDVSVASVAFYADGQLLNTDTSSPYSFSWTNATAGPHTLTAVATDSSQQSTTSAPVSISVVPPGPGATAAFVTTDTTTEGNWPTIYGSQGYVIVNDATSLPAYASVTAPNASAYTWAGSSTDIRALDRATTNRIAATWYDGAQFDINIGLTDGVPHRVALYCLDWDNGGRTERLDVYDAGSNTLLDSRTVSSFVGGKYLVWTITGNVRVRVTNTGPLNAVVSGVFIGAASGNQPPTVSLTSPSDGAQFTTGTPISLAATATDDVSVANVAFYADGQLLNTDPSSPYSFSWTNAAVGPHTVTAVATDGNQQSTTSAPVSIMVAAPSPGATAAFVTTDAATQGNWSPTYGAQGYVIVNDATSLPAYATVSAPGVAAYTWMGSSSDIRALRRATTNRIAATWYDAAQFDINIGLSDGATHTVALYCLDWDNGGRTERLDVYDAASNALLDSRTVSSFVGGKYLVWTIKGNVRIHVTNTSWLNAVVSGVFISAGTAPANLPPPISSSTIALRADLIGTLGGGGNATSPIVAGGQLLLLNQTGTLYRWNGSSAVQILTAASAPVGVTPVGVEAILNAAANSAGTSVFVMYTSSSVPAGLPQFVSPRPGADAWQVLYRYDFNGTTLSNPQGIVALQVRSDGHTGGGMLALDTGPILFATGDNGDAGEDGRQYAQDASNHLSKILRIDPVAKTVAVLAIGVRNVQRLFLNPNSGDPRVEFADLGGAISEEFNSVRLADLLASPAKNFGWGRNAGDNLAREGTFYIDPAGAVTGVAPTPEAGFAQPLAQFGREGAPLVAVTGPVSSSASFTNITALFGDLPTGNVLAVTGVPGTSNQTVYRVNLVDSTLIPVTLSGLAGGRPDPRFFLFPDGTAGVLLERTGSFYRLTQIGQ